MLLPKGLDDLLHWKNKRERKLLLWLVISIILYFPAVGKKIHFFDSLSPPPCWLNHLNINFNPIISRYYYFLSLPKLGWHGICFFFTPDEGGEREMPETQKTNRKVVNAMLDKKTQYVRVADWDGKSLSFILADEICLEEKPALSDQQIEKK
jgi:hypothetical protein